MEVPAPAPRVPAPAPAVADIVDFIRTKPRCECLLAELGIAVHWNRHIDGPLSTFLQEHHDIFIYDGSGGPGQEKVLLTPDYIPIPQAPAVADAVDFIRTKPHFKCSLAELGIAIRWNRHIYGPLSTFLQEHRDVFIYDGSGGPGHEKVLLTRNYIPFSHKILIIDSGGTIACPGEGGALAPGGNVIDAFVRTNEIFNSIERFVDVDDVGFVFPVPEFPGPPDSSSMDKRHWKRLVSYVREILSDDPERPRPRPYSGIVITHGTDTLAYSAAILTFAFKYLHTPIVMTASQFPLRSLYTDARNNLYGACIVALGWDPAVPQREWYIPEVTVFFNHKLFRGCRICKVDSSETDAFDTPGDTPLGAWTGSFLFNKKLIREILKSRIEMLRGDAIIAAQAHPSEPLWHCPEYREMKIRLRESPRCRRFIGDDVEWPDTVLVKHSPGNYCAFQLQALFDACNVRHFVIEAFGSGNFHPDVLAWINEHANDRYDCFFAIVTQCARGYVCRRYAAGGLIRSPNIAYCADITAECALAKITVWEALNRSYGLRRIQFQEFMEKSVRQELTIFDEPRDR